MTQAQVFNLLMAALPHPESVRDLNMDRPAKLEFTIRDQTFQVDCETLSVNQVEGGGNFLSGGFETQLLSQLLKKQHQLNGSK